MASYNNFREPVEYIIKQYWRKKLLRIKCNNTIQDELPEYPFRIVRNAHNKVERIIYAEGELMEWQEELIRDWRGKVTRIKVTLPKLDDEIDYYYIDLARNQNDQVFYGEVNN
ncbi:hypothetical protein FDJ70_07550 [Clostridium botulinum]|uniref:hypothetical protein n=1 Tax=Clostridium TaxID=1485 RepID=UPI0004D3CD89|nr:MULTISPECIES: hypothetical protein [Clostridium]KEI08003.1 hypothetical protein Z958_p0078 [Clostridium novyi B str. NCTC 9691]MCD3217492.1 hypothetical protein [Clostridium botulinum C]NFV47527.1 hypothetical protein [Clostridium botulinum]